MGRGCGGPAGVDAVRYSEGDEAGEGCAGDATETEEADCACGCEVGGADLRTAEKERCPGFVGPLIYYSVK